jgi:hypothetical protein
MCRIRSAVFAFACLGDAQVQRVVPIGTFQFEARGEQSITLDHHLRIGGLHREDEVVEVVLAANARELEGALDHAQRRISVPVHDAVAQGSVIGADSQGAAESLGLQDQRSEAGFDAGQFLGVGFVGVVLDRELLAVGVVARINADFFHPLDRFHGGFRLEMDIGHDGDMAAHLMQFTDDVFEVRRVLHGGGRDADNLATHGHELECLSDALGRVHRVAGEHRLLDHGVVSPEHHTAETRVAHGDFTGGSAAETPRRWAILHESLGGINGKAAGLVNALKQ